MTTYPDPDDMTAAKRGSDHDRAEAWRIIALGSRSENERLKVENLGLLRSFVGVVVNITATANEVNETIKAQLAHYEVKP